MAIQATNRIDANQCQLIRTTFGHLNIFMFRIDLSIINSVFLLFALEC